MRHAAHEAARVFLDGLAEDLVNTNDADFEGRLEEWTAQGFPELAFYRGDRPRGRGEIIAEIRKAQRALDGDTRALAQATRDELPVLAGALRVAARSLTDEAGEQVQDVGGMDDGEPLRIIYRDGLVLPSLPSDEPPAVKSILPARPRPKPEISSKPMSEMPFQMVNPLWELPRLRSDDPDRHRGDPEFGAERVRQAPQEGGTYVSEKYEHQGLDIAAPPGTFMRSPVSGTVRIGYPYSEDLKNPKKTDGYKIIWITTDDGDEVGMFYVTPYDGDGDQWVKDGDRVEAGRVVGKMQDRAAISPGMENHFHLKVRHNGKTIDPTPWLKGWRREYGM